MHAQDVLTFWFGELTPKQHFNKDAALDALMRDRFGATLDSAARGWIVRAAAVKDPYGRST